MFYGIIYLNVFLGMRVLALFWVVLCGISPANAASHSLKYFYTAVTAGIDFPEFTVVGLVDDEPFVHYDSNSRRMIPKTEWIKESVEADYWDGQTQRALGTQQSFKANIGTAMQRFNQTQGVHTFQYMYGCEWDDETGATGGFDQYGYDGEDFVTYDMENQRFIAPVQQAFITAVKWNHNPAGLEYEKQYLTQECVDWLKKYVSYRRSALERTVAPKVSLLQKDSPSPGLTCHVTGFYPHHGVMVTWQRNGEDLHEDVELGETVPNGDGTFQTRSHLRVKPEDWKSQEYTCTVQHKGLEQDIVVSFKNGSSPPMGIIIGCVLGALILILTVNSVVIWKKRSLGYGKTSSYEKSRIASEVSPLQKDPFFPGLTCHVTGFPPPGVMVTWQKDGKDLDEDMGGTVPNGDGTFQTRSHLTVKPEDWKSQKYTCTVQHKSLKQDIILSVKEENIKRNRALDTDSGRSRQISAESFDSTTPMIRPRSP